MDLSLELQVPSRTEYIAVVRLVVASLVSALRSVAAERIDDLKLAVSEACTNAIEANVASSGGRQPVVVRVWEAPERLEVLHRRLRPGLRSRDAAGAPPCD